MQITVKLYATLRRFTPDGRPGKPISVDLADEATLLDLIHQLKIPPEETRITFVNGVIHESDWKLKAGDEVGIFPPIGGGSMTEILVDVWLYGELSCYGGEANRGGHANLKVKLLEGSTIRDLLAVLQMPTEERGISFINGELSAMPNLQPDLEHPLKDNDRVAFFDLHSMWPFQYRHGIPMAGEMAKEMGSSTNQGIHHAYKKK